MRDSFKTRTTLAVGNQSYEINSLPALQGHDLGRLPFSLKILLENLLRFEDGVNVTRDDIEALLKWDAKAAPSHEIAFTPARVIMQDFTGVPAIVDLAAMREAMVRLGGNPQEINPLAPAELVIDHSVQVDEYGTADSRAAGTARSSSPATANAIRSCAGARRRSAISRSCRPAPASCTRSTSSTLPASCLPRTRTA
jgi:aconitate hydratase